MEAGGSLPGRGYNCLTALTPLILLVLTYQYTQKMTYTNINMHIVGTHTTRHSITYTLSLHHSLHHSITYSLTHLLTHTTQTRYSHFSTFLVTARFAFTLPPPPPSLPRFLPAVFFSFPDISTSFWKYRDLVKE